MTLFSWVLSWSGEPLRAQCILVAVRRAQGNGVYIEVRDKSIFLHKSRFRRFVCEYDCLLFVGICIPANCCISVTVCWLVWSFSLSARVLPLIVMECEVPSILKHLTYLDNTNEDVQPHFTDKLLESLEKAGKWRKAYSGQCGAQGFIGLQGSQATQETRKWDNSYGQ